MVSLSHQTTPSYLEPYRNALAREGDVFSSLLWASPHTQKLRFEAIQHVQDMNHRTVLDVGCGHGDLLDFLHRRGIVPMHYVGLEAIDEFARRTEAKHHPHALIVRGDFLADPVKMFVGAEIVIFCGSLNTLDRPAFFSTIRRAFEATAEVLVFNFLSSPELAGRDYLTWHQPDSILGFCRELSSDVKLHTGYLNGDATIRVRKIGEVSK